MIDIKLVKSLFFEYKPLWIINRALYAGKIKMLTYFPFIEKIFETKIPDIKQIDIFDFDVESIKNFINDLSDLHKTQLIKYANNAVEGKLMAFSSFYLDYGNPIRWNYNPITKKTVPLNKKWFTIPDFDNERGDIKVIWESSRFSHFYYFSRAYLLTEDIKYYNAFHFQLKDWIKRNKYGYGPNYKCGQECSLRMINCLINYTIFNYFGLTTDEDKKLIEQLIYDSYRKVLNNFFYADKCIKNNHTISELLGMIIGSWCCKDSKKLKYSFKKINKVMKEQFFDDGGYIQFSFNYQRLALQDIECLMSISKKISFEFDKDNLNRIHKSVLLLYQLQAKNGFLPNYGSNDGALIYPITSCSYQDFRPIINSLNYMISGTRLYPSGSYDEEMIWFSGKKALNSFVSSIDKKSKFFIDTGIYQLIKGNVKINVVLNNFKNRPAHLDQLHFDLWVENRNVFCDSGTYSYATELGKKLSLTSGHNTVKLSNKEQMNKKGAFFIYSWTKKEKVMFSDTTFEGEMISQNGYIHKRSIDMHNISKGTEIVIVDDIMCGENIDFVILFHTPYELQTDENIIYIFDNKDKIGEVKGKNYEIYKTKRSLFYMKASDINCICFRGHINDGYSKTETKIIIYKNGEEKND